MTLDALQRRFSGRTNATRSALMLLAFAAQVAWPRTGLGQSLLDRSPNVSGDWTGAPGTLYFNFLHRFSASSSPERKVSNIPTFLLGAGLPWHTLVGLNYSTNSTLASRFPNEYEFFARWSPFSEDFGAPVDIGAQVDYNNAADGGDAELSVAKRLGVTRVLVAGRALSDPLRSGHAQLSVAGGATIRLGPYVALAGDVASLSDRPSGEPVAWSAGLQLAIPLSPHTLSLQATNTTVGTLQGESRGTKTVRYGFEFTIPITLKRYFGNHEPPPPPVVASQPTVDTAASRVRQVDSLRVDTAARPTPPVTDTVSRAIPQPTTPTPEKTPTPPPNDSARKSPVAAAPKPAPAARIVRTGMRNITYLQSRIEITVGSTIEWKNNDPLAHTVTATDKSFDSGNIMPGQTWKHTFTKPGTYSFYCTPHPFMKGVIVVRGQ